MFRNTLTAYGSVAKFLHWLIALLVIGLLCVGPFMGDIQDKALRGQVYTFHKLTGLTILILMILRVTWTLTNAKPLLPNIPAWQRFAQKGVHFMLYVLLLAMPLSGWIMSTAAGHPPSFFGPGEMPFPGIAENKPLAESIAKVHLSLAIIIATFLVIHIAAALQHHYVDRDNVLRRMLPGSS